MNVSSARPSNRLQRTVRYAPRTPEPGRWAALDKQGPNE